MTENKRYVIEEIGNMFRVLKDNEPLTTKFENTDKQDVINLIGELNELNDKIKELQFQVNLLREQANEFHRGARENANRVRRLERKNNELKEELRIYRQVANCHNCEYHDYDWFDDGDEFEVCRKGNDVTEGICKDWEEL